ncbi:FtsB family cell division protein [Ferdinandcohnia quinoae]|uniref:Septum formation initiator family protein n=1 Tax=Fredinandcohnia quinoae TaxID=2918902 RepID=A0AAW5E1Y7_9BACI|nr:septum formation initiator family protein [Fredinandcohnia sp. SECRCQ15]MCH1626927.1 septum formation initiator family protein [Fredinandcohnia sp. SECRCQ15]
MSAIRKKNVTKLQSTYMEKYHQQEQVATTKRKGLVRRLVVFGLLAGIMTYGMITTILSQQEAMDDKQQKKVALEKELSGLKNDQTILEEEIVKLNNDEYLAKILRRDFFLSKEGEIIFKVNDGS